MSWLEQYFYILLPWLALWGIVIIYELRSRDKRKLEERIKKLEERLTEKQDYEDRTE